MKQRNFIIVLAILLFSAALSIASYLPSRSDVTLNIKVADFPKQINGWNSKEIEVSARAYEILETRNLFLREYSAPAKTPVYMYLIYSEDNRKVSHPPEVCLMGSGESIVDKKDVQLTPGINAVSMVVEKGDNRQLVVYWYKAGSSSTNKYIDQQLRVVIDRLLGKRTAGALVRLSTDIKDDNKQTALQEIKGFAKEIEPLLAKYVP